MSTNRLWLLPRDTLWLLKLVHDLAQVIAGRILHGREILVGLQFLELQRLPDREKVPVVDVRRRRRGKGTARAEKGLILLSDGSLERIALDVDDLGPGVRKRACDETGRIIGDHREVDLPVPISHGRWLRTRVVEKDLARRLRRLARQVVDLVVAIEHRFNDARVLARHDLLVQVISFRAARDLDERWHPVERREDVVEDGSRLDNP